MQAKPHCDRTLQPRATDPAARADEMMAGGGGDPDRDAHSGSDRHSVC